MKHIVPLVVACFIGSPWSLARAQESLLALPVRAGDGVSLTLHDNTASHGAADVLRVFVGPPEDCCTAKRPIAGQYEIEGRTVTFNPAFEFIEGQTYTVQSRDATPRLTGFVIAARGAAPDPKVVAVYPSGPTIPENTLRFYIEFSAPMMPHRADEFIKLVDSNGMADSAAFMSFTQELWNEDRTRLTLLMDPGRIKRGVAQNIALGPALLEGERHSIVISEGWPSAKSGKGAPGSQHWFTVSPPLRQLPDVDLWHIQRPAQATIAPLLIAFDRPFDHQLLHSAITVLDADAQRVSGTISVEDHQRRWRFQPDAKWQTPTLRIIVDTALEDVAGNNFIDLLDHSLGTQAKTRDFEVIALDLAPPP